MVDIASHEHQTKIEEQRREYELTEEQMGEYRAQCAGTAPMQQIFYVLACQARDWSVPIPKDLEVYYDKYKKDLEESQRLKNILRMTQAEFIDAMRQECPNNLLQPCATAS